MSRGFGGTSKRKSNNGLLFLIVLLFIIALGILGYILLKPKPVQQNKKVQTFKLVDVIVPKRKIAVGELLTEELFIKVKKPELAIDESVIKSFAELKNGFYSNTVLNQDQLLLKDYLTVNKPNTALSGRIPPGFRAVTIKVTAISGVEGWATPGSKVDVYWTSSIDGEAIVNVIVENAEVLSAERKVSANQDPNSPVPSTVTLLVTAEEAKLIHLAANSGSLSLSLRGDKDATGNLGGPVSIDEISGRPKISTTTTRTVRRVGTVTIDGVKWAVDENGDLIPLD